MTKEARDFKRTLMTSGRGGGKRNEQLSRLFELLLEGLIARVKSEEASAADFQAARQFLKDSNYEFDKDNPPEAVKRLIDELPDLDNDPDWPGNVRPN